MTETMITKAGFEKLKAELEELSTTGRAEIAERIRRAAAAEANAVESVEYQDAREDQAMLERRIALLEDTLAHAVVVEPDAENDLVDLGERVTVRNVATGEIAEYELVGSLEAAPSAGRISVASPLGQALLGRRTGEVAAFDAPRGRIELEVIAIADAEPGPTTPSAVAAA